MKQLYETPMMEIIKFSTQDVITTSTSDDKTKSIYSSDEPASGDLFVGVETESTSATVNN